MVGEGCGGGGAKRVAGAEMGEEDCTAGGEAPDYDLQAGSGHQRILRLGRLRLRGPCGARDEFLLAATAQNLRKLAKLRPMATPA